MNVEKNTRTPRKPHAELKKKALQSAELIVVEEGLAALTARRVAGETGFSVGTLYNIFGHLDGLIAEVNLATFRQMAEDGPWRRTFLSDVLRAGQTISNNKF